ncbi:methionine/alanine import family NSS transporter small subunit [Mobilicoccus caccae]|uniref:Methionine/alanine importer small subunit n=1 Tax=Mobilicoccus caccae TaxID=1859295 RepID=A0ABQ6IUF2_9MICO|nr:methionine/alanine import family NSS transporter small subunit [Mobilicoccus caccae]GMA40772.1 hypothetical protein GCM10025883_28170 [Mobilicoccus caccae]
MTPIALTFLILSILLVWGGLAVSIIALVRSSKGSNGFGDDVTHDTP